MTAQPPTPGLAGPRTATLAAALWMIGAIVSFSAMAVAGRAVAFELDTFEIMLYRSLIGVAVVVSVAVAMRRTREFATRRIGLHGLRNVSHFAGQNLWFFAITAAPLTEVFALEFTSPLWVTLLAPLVLGERLTRVRVLAAALGFIGVLIVTRPNIGAPGIGLIAAAAAALGFAGSALFTRLLTRTETVLTILFWLTAMQSVFGLICAGYDGDIAWPSAAAWPWIAVIGAAGLVAHLCLTKALALAPAAVVMPIDFARLPVIALIGVALYGEPLDALVLLGGAVIFAANYLNIKTESPGRGGPRG